jgi:hypothetical protein
VATALPSRLRRTIMGTTMASATFDPVWRLLSVCALGAFACAPRADTSASSEPTPPSDVAPSNVAPAAAAKRAPAAELEVDQAATERLGPPQYRGALELSGYLRMSWLVDRSGEAESRELVMRFFPDEASSSVLPGEEVWVLSLYRARAEPSGDGFLDFETDALVQLIEDSFEVVPPEFWSHREGHAEQPGWLRARDLAVEVVADRAYHASEFVEFEASRYREDPAEVRERLEAQAERAGPAHAAFFEELYVLAAAGALYAEPSPSAPVLAELPADTPVVKRRTVSDAWLEVSLAFEPHTRGFIQRAALLPLD